MATLFGIGSYAGHEPIAGGYGYSKVVSPDDPGVIVVRTLSDLKAKVVAGATVYIDDDYTIEWPSYAVNLPSPLHIASGCGRGGSPGGMISNPYTGGPDYASFLMGSALKLTGLRLGGPSASEAGKLVSGVQGFAEIENCDIFNWPYAGFWSTGKSWIHHSRIHECQREGFGYGAGHGPSCDSLIECCHFRNCRHMVMGVRGLPGTKYHLRWNIFEEGSSSHTLVDMHGPNDTTANGDGPLDASKAASNIANYPAGHTLIIEQNTFLTHSQPAVGVRGVPVGIVICRFNHVTRQGSQRDNFRQKLDQLIGQVVDGKAITGQEYVRMVVENNYIGETPPDDGTPVPPPPVTPPPVFPPPIIPPVTPPPGAASFVFSNLVISPAQVQGGQTANVSVMVANTGGTAGAVQVDLTGWWELSQTVTLAAGESRKVTFTFAPSLGASLGPKPIEIANLSGTLTIVAATTPTPPPTTGPHFDYSNLTINPASVKRGSQTSLISVTVTNSGGSSGSVVVKLTGWWVLSTTITLAAGASKTVTFKVTPSRTCSTGPHPVIIGPLSGSLTVTR